MRLYARLLGRARDGGGGYPRGPVDRSVTPERRRLRAVLLRVGEGPAAGRPGHSDWGACETHAFDHSSEMKLKRSFVAKLNQVQVLQRTSNKNIESQTEYGKILTKRSVQFPE